MSRNLFIFTIITQGLIMMSGCHKASIYIFWLTGQTYVEAIFKRWSWKAIYSHESLTFFKQPVTDLSSAGLSSHLLFYFYILASSLSYLRNARLRIKLHNLCPLSQGIKAFSFPVFQFTCKIRGWEEGYSNRGIYCSIEITDNYALQMNLTLWLVSGFAKCPGPNWD